MMYAKIDLNGQLIECCDGTLLISGTANAPVTKINPSAADLLAAGYYPLPEVDGAVESWSVVDDALVPTYHATRTDNPHGVTKAQVGLGNVDNTADASKPVSTAQREAIDAHANRTDNPHGVTAAQLGLSTAYVYKGSVANFESLPTADVENGFVYNVEDTGNNYAAIVSGGVITWDKLSGTVDLSNYPTNADVTAAIAAATADCVKTTNDGDVTINGKLTVAGSCEQGNDNVASGLNSHAEGNTSSASGAWSHAEGYHCGASGSPSHAEGWACLATAKGSHSEGMSSYAYGQASHAEGANNFANGHASHAAGRGSKAAHDGSWAWNGQTGYDATNSYQSKGEGTFNINPVGGIEGFYVGDKNLSDLIAAAPSSITQKLAVIGIIDGVATVALTTGGASIHALTLSTDAVSVAFTKPADVTAADVVTFELLVTMPETAVELTFPSTVTWIGDAPTIEAGKKTLLVFRSFGTDSQWVGNIQGAW